MGSLISKALSTEAQRIQRARLGASAAILFHIKRGFILYVLGVVALIVLGSGAIPELHKKGYANNIDENAMLPGQANMYFAQGDSRRFDLPEGGKERAETIELQLRRFGLDTSTQTVRITKNNVTEEFYNVYGIVRAPRAPGTESILLSAPWTCMDGDHNINGFNYLLSLAAYFPKFSHWSKDIIILFTDGGLIGTRAWLEAYHGSGDSFHPDVKASPILHHGGVIEEALNLEFPAAPQNSYDSLAVYTQGLNGQQPNADIPMVVATAAGTFGIPIRLHRSRSEAGAKVVEAVKGLGVPALPVENIVSLAEYMAIQAVGIPQSHHALFPKYKIEGVTLAGVRNPGDHLGSVDGQRVCLTVESTFRSYSSLLERLHHAYWFYFMFSMFDYLPIAFYIGPIALLSVNFVFEAFILFMEGEFVLDLKELRTEPYDKETNFLIRPAGISSFLKAPRPMQLPVAVISICYAVSWTVYSLVWKNLDSINAFPLPTLLASVTAAQLVFALALISILSIVIPSASKPAEGPAQWKLLKSLTYSLLGATLLTISSLNPSLSALIALPLFPVAFLFAKPASNIVERIVKVLAIGVMSPAGILAVLVFALGEARALEVVGALGGAGYWLEGWGLDVIVGLVWPLVLSLQVLVGGF